MLQISNIDDGKSEWNINETHIIIPMIDGDVTSKESDKILSTLTLNSLEGGDQTILTNALESSLVIGLDKNIFETPNYKSDLVIIQNSNLKTPVTYTLSYVNEDKSEILWQAPISKDRICGSDKAILEVRDVLNYDESVHELEKNEQQNLHSIDNDISSKVDKTKILTEDTVCEQKKETQFINYYLSSQNSDADPILPHLDVSKFVENVQVVQNKKLFENKHPSEPHILVKNGEETILSVNKPVMEINGSMPIILDECIKPKTEKKTVINRNKDTKNEKVEQKLMIKGVSNFLPEKSLPLKKKAKMKRNIVSFGCENRGSMLKQDVSVSHVNVKFPTEKKNKKLLTITSLQEEEDPSNSSSDEPSIKKGTKRKKAATSKPSPKKVQKYITKPLVKEDKNKSKNLGSNPSAEDSAIKINFCTFDRNKFKNIYDLVECLRKCRLINATVWQTLNSGLKEMKVDILKEMNAKINNSPEKAQYSPHLKAFALVLYFKQPAAFNHLSQVYKTGWPSLNVIKEWKRRINSQQRPNFIRAERYTDNSNS